MAIRYLILGLVPLTLTTIAGARTGAAIDASSLFLGPHEKEVSLRLTDEPGPSLARGSAQFDAPSLARLFGGEVLGQNVDLTAQAAEAAPPLSDAPSPAAVSAEEPAMDPADMARVLGLDPDAGETLQITREAYNPRTGLTTFHAQQMHQGKPVLDGQVAVTIDETNALGL